VVVVAQEDEEERCYIVIIVMIQVTPSTTAHYYKQSRNNHFDLLMCIVLKIRFIGRLVGRLIVIIGIPCNITFSALIMRSGT